MGMEMSVDKKDITKKIAGFVRNHEEIIFAYIFGSFIEDEVFNNVDVAIYVRNYTCAKLRVFMYCYFSYFIYT